jgi:hypothetical protein
MRLEGFAAMQARDLAKERETARSVGIGKRRQEEPPEQAGKYPHRRSRR